MVLASGSGPTANTQQSLACPLCENAGASLELRSNNGYPIVRCSLCGLVYTDMRDAPAPPLLYPEFDQSDSGFSKTLSGALGAFTRRREQLVRSVKAQGRLLDFGCGSGAFARWMALGGGYDVVGLEPFSLGRPTQSDRLLLIREPLESAAPRIGRFDVITLWHVLEHLNRPTEVLRRLSELLAPDGIVIVSVPNFRSWQSRLFRGGWFHLDPPRHVVHFEVETLKRCIHAAGLVPIRDWNFLPEYGLSGWVQSTLNRIVSHPNYLYELIKDRGAVKGLGVVTHGVFATTSILAGGPTLALSMPVEALASAFGGGAALTVAAKRLP
jgi:SAM-dependent methyltransferase